MADSCSITLNDGSNTVTVLVSEEDAQRCETDLAFAQSVMRAAMAVEAEVPQHIDVEENGNASVEGTESAFKWQHNAILMLVELYRKYEADLTSGKIAQKKVWDKIAVGMAANGHNVSGAQCMSKMNGMKRTYKAIKDHNGKSGNNPRSWPYLAVMDSLLGERPFMEPPALASSSSSSSRKRTFSESSTECTSDSTSTSGKASKERKEGSRKASKQGKIGDDSIAAAIVESRRIAEEGKKQRHEESMARKDMLLDKLNALIEKI